MRGAGPASELQVEAHEHAARGQRVVVGRPARPRRPAGLAREDTGSCSRSARCGGCRGVGHLDRAAAACPALTQRSRSRVARRVAGRRSRACGGRRRLRVVEVGLGHVAARRPTGRATAPASPVDAEVAHEGAGSGAGARRETSRATLSTQLPVRVVHVVELRPGADAAAREVRAGREAQRRRGLPGGVQLQPAAVAAVHVAPQGQADLRQLAA